MAVTFRNVLSFVVARGCRDYLYGEVVVNVAYGGARYVSAPAGPFGLAVRLQALTDRIGAGREIKHALVATEVARHSADSRDSLGTGIVLR